MRTCPTCGHENADGAKFCNECASPLVEPAAPGREQRKTVTVLFCDVTGSTGLGEQLDPEALRALLARYFERMKGIVARHGGTVEKFIGDAVMAVFGVPQVHEDDALRAVRAAAEMRAVFPELGIEGRIGVATGEVVTGTEERLATGDAVNVAARLEQAAQPSEILIAEETWRLTRDAVEVEALEPLALKGKSGPVAAYRLVSVSADEGPVRSMNSPMVGREREQRLLASVWERVTSERACQLFTILGPAGVGKSRLAAEFLASLGPDALVVRGRCLPYGEGITYWPVVEVLKQLPESVVDAAATETVRALVGDEQLVTSGGEIAWGVRKLLEAVAGRRPLVCVFDDVHWGEETFLELIEHVADLSRDAPILLLCIARPELLDRRPGWAGGKVNATSALLEPLDAAETDRLIESLAHLDDGLRGRIREVAEGNPLFVEEMVAMVRESPDGDVTVPPTIQALLAARLDQLDASERDVLQCGAIEGRVFHRGAVEVLAPDEQHVTTRLTALVRKELVRPDTPQLAGEDAFRFRHLLIRDAAYEALPKASRAELHERFALWLEEHGAALVELDEIVGYHLEQACGYRRELGASEDETRALGVRGAERFAVSGRRALDRSDLPAAINLLDRALALLPGEGELRLRLRLLPPLGRALLDRGDWERAKAVLSEAAETGEAEGERGVAADAAAGLCFLRLHTDPDTSHDEITRDLDDAIRVLEEVHDEAALARAASLAGLLPFWRGDAEAALPQLEQAALHARRAGDRSQELFTLRSLLTAAFHGPMPVEAVLELIDDVAGRATGSSALDVSILNARAHLEAMRGQIDTGRALIVEAGTLARELGFEAILAQGVAQTAGEIELLADEPEAAARELRPACEMLERIGDWGHFATLAPYLADALLAQGRGDEAAPTIDLASRWTLADDADAQIGWRRVQGKLLAQRGDLEEAERFGREAVERATHTDYLNLHARALADLAEVLTSAGKTDEAVGALEKSLGLYERKGNSVMAERVRARLADVRR
jgi:class 3 adenylate cyclase/tetratricopeptide (TPR) repeat protein